MQRVHVSPPRALLIFGVTAALATLSPVWAHNGPDFVSVNTSADSGTGSLREAINLANDDAETQIVFRIPITDPAYDPKTGVFTLVLQSPLPPITGPDTVFDGLAQTLAYDSNKKGPEIKISGKKLPLGTSGIVIRAARCEIKGLTIADFPGHGIVINGPEALENLVQTNVIEHNRGCGVVISDGASANRVGIADERGKNLDEEFKGLYGAPANKFIGNGEDAVRISGSDSTGNSVRGNDFLNTNWLPIRLRTENDTGVRPVRLDSAPDTPNGGQLPPGKLAWGAAKKLLTGVVRGKPNSTYVIDVSYRAGNSGAWRYASAVKAVTNENGVGDWSLKVKSAKPASVRWGATATARDGSTSEMAISGGK
jgi:hypothetical protein